MDGFRRQAIGVADHVLDQLTPALEAAVQNEQLTRKRVEALEELARRPLRGRLEWLFLGR